MSQVGRQAYRIRKQSPIRWSERQKPEVPALFDGLKIFAYTLIPTVVAIVAYIPGVGFERLWEWPHEASDTPLFFLRLAMFVLLCVWSLRWIWATQRELTFWVIWMPEFHFARWEAVAAMLGLAPVLGTLIASAHNLPLCTGLMAATAFMNYWTQAVANEHFVDAVALSREQEVEPWREEVLEAMERFWLDRPQMGRIVAIMFAHCLTFTVAVAGATTSSPERSRMLYIAAAVMFIVTTVAGEVVVAVWRRRLSRDIEDIDCRVGQAKYAHAHA